MNVLILIVVEDGLVLGECSSIVRSDGSLNPYCSGRWSRTDLTNGIIKFKRKVLILIVVEDGLVQLGSYVRFIVTCLNPYCSGRWSRTLS